MQNLEQIRARNALAFALKPLGGQQGGDVIKNLPHLIMNHGLLAVGAYGFADNQHPVGRVLDAIAQHLADKEIAIVDAACTDKAKLMEFLTRKETSSETLKLATAEAMAWLAFAKRFVKKG